jgi:hypothetical protein
VKNSAYILFPVLLTTMLLGGCNNSGKRLNERVTIWRKDKIPYGAFYAFEELSHVFPNAEIIIDKDAPGGASGSFLKPNVQWLDKYSDHKGKTVSFILSPNVLPSSSELQSILNFVYEGNQVFASAFRFSPEMLDTLGLKTAYSPGYFSDSLEVSIEDPEKGRRMTFAYPGKQFDNYFSDIDTEFTTVLGRNENGQPNFVRISYNNGGAIFLHLAPLAFSNFFLLHKDNKRYYDCALSYLPKDTELVSWGDYFRSHSNGNDNNNSDGSNSTSRALSWMLSQPPLAWGLSLLLALFLFLFVFGSKRRQRIIAERKPLKNTSLDFVKTIGRLYFQRRDNKNLADKMTAHFLEHVRNKFNIPTSRMDTEFEKKLSHKSGIEFATVHNIVYHAKYLSEQTEVSDAELMHLNKQLQNFYKQA